MQKIFLTIFNWWYSARRYADWHPEHLYPSTRMRRRVGDWWEYRDMTTEEIADDLMHWSVR